MGLFCLHSNACLLELDEKTGDRHRRRFGGQQNSMIEWKNEIAFVVYECILMYIERIQNA